MPGPASRATIKARGASSFRSGCRFECLRAARFGRRAKVGEAGIRTLDTGFSPYNGLANRRLQPLGHLTADLQVYGTSELAQNISVKGRRFFASRRSWDCAGNCAV